jgi:L-iditol 2-dehydrogenase
MVELVRKKGRISVIGLTGGKTVELPWDKFAFKVLDVYFNLSTSYTSWDRSISLIAGGQIPAEKIITHRGPLEKWESLFDAVEQLHAIKALILPAGEKGA